MNSDKTTTGAQFLRFVLSPKGDRRVFFGGEKSAFKDEYYLSSGYWPQQTTLLGMLRRLILEKSGHIDDDLDQREDWPALIGKSSFDGTANQNFGIIERISPLALYHKALLKEYYCYRYPGHLKPRKLVGDIKTNYGGTTFTQLQYFAGNEDKNASLYDPKQHHFSEKITDFGNATYPIESEMDESHYQNFGVKRTDHKGIFYKNVKDGITKNYLEDQKEDGFFKTESWHMSPEWAYSFRALIQNTDSIPNWLDKAEVFLGGDSCPFRLEAEVCDDWIGNAGTGDILVLLSDALVGYDIYNHCPIVVTDTVPFRNILTEYNDVQFNKRPVLKWKGEDTIGAGQARVLLKKGSILFAEEGKGDTVAKALQNNAFQKIGYNHFQRLIKLI